MSSQLPTPNQPSGTQPPPAEQRVLLPPQDRVRMAGKQAAKGTWTFEVTMEAPVIGEIRGRAQNIAKKRQALNGGRQLDADGIASAVEQAIDDLLGERAEIMALAVSKCHQQWKEYGWAVQEVPVG